MRYQSVLAMAMLVSAFLLFGLSACISDTSPKSAQAPSVDRVKSVKQGSGAAQPPLLASSTGEMNPFVGNEALPTAQSTVQSDEVLSPVAGAEAVTLDGKLVQGGLVFGKTLPGARVRLDDVPVMVGDAGDFVFGFSRDAPLSALLTIALPGGHIEERQLSIEDRDFRVERINGLDQSRVSGFTEAQLERIGVDREKKKAARSTTQRRADWRGGFDWPAHGRISGVFGSQRVLNGEAKRPHSGLDIAAPTGTPVKAPAAGIIRLAESNMYFEGGLVLLDHGHWVESAFLHLSRLDVEPGQRVEKGDIIGAIGKTGRATGPHLHWSVKWRGRVVDPQLLVPAGGNTKKPS
ncbi:MAG: M23 family metallopeptidase [Pseudomonadota bacterium]